MPPRTAGFGNLVFQSVALQLVREPFQFQALRMDSC